MLSQRHQDDPGGRVRVVKDNRESSPESFGEGPSYSTRSANSRPPVHRRMSFESDESNDAEAERSPSKSTAARASVKSPPTRKIQTQEREPQHEAASRQESQPRQPKHDVHRFAKKAKDRVRQAKARTLGVTNIPHVGEAMNRDEQEWTGPSSLLPTTFVRFRVPEELLTESSIPSKRMHLSISVTSPIHLGGETVDGSVRVSFHGRDNGEYRMLKVMIDFLGIEEISFNKRQIFLNVASDLINNEHPEHLPPRAMLVEQKNPPLGCWIMKPSRTSIPFGLKLPVNVGLGSFNSAKARVRYVCFATVHFLQIHNNTLHIVRTNGDVKVIPKLDTVDTLRPLDHPLCSINRINLSATKKREISVEACVRRAVWVSGGSAFVEVHVTNRSNRRIRAIQLVLQRKILAYKKGIARSGPLSAGSIRVPDWTEKKDISASLTYLGKHKTGTKGMMDDKWVCEIEIPRNQLSIPLERFFEVKYEIKIRLISYLARKLKAHLPITIVHMVDPKNSLDLFPTHQIFSPSVSESDLDSQGTSEQEETPVSTPNLEEIDISTTKRAPSASIATRAQAAQKEPKQSFRGSSILKFPTIQTKSSNLLKLPAKTVGKAKALAGQRPHRSVQAKPDFRRALTMESYAPKLNISVPSIGDPDFKERPIVKVVKTRKSTTRMAISDDEDDEALTISVKKNRSISKPSLTTEVTDAKDVDESDRHHHYRRHIEEKVIEPTREFISDIWINHASRESLHTNGDPLQPIVITGTGSDSIRGDHLLRKSVSFTSEPPRRPVPEPPWTPTLIPAPEPTFEQTSGSVEKRQSTGIGGNWTQGPRGEKVKSLAKIFADKEAREVREALEGAETKPISPKSSRGKGKVKGKLTQPSDGSYFILKTRGEREKAHMAFLR